MKKIVPLVIAICVVVLGILLLVTSLTGTELPRLLTYAFWILVIANGVLTYVFSKKKD